MAIKQFFATNNARTDNGYQAFETLGRRVGGQYDQAGNDLRDIGRAKADVINMVGRWPFNIIELEERSAARAALRSSSAAQTSTLPARGYSVRVVGSGSSITDGQFAPRVMPNLASLNELSEGAAYLGRSLGGSQLPYLAEKSRIEAQQFNREQSRKLAAAQNAWQKRWDLYEKGLDKYNEGLEKRGSEYVKSQDELLRTEGGYGSYGPGGENPGSTPPASSVYDAEGRNPWDKGYTETEEPFYGGGGYSSWNPIGWFLEH